MKSGNCYHCGQTLQNYTREARCPNCDKAVHICLNCLYHKPGIHNDCQEPIADFVSDKYRPNFCDYFSPKTHSETDQINDDADALRQAADDLFNF